MLYNVAGIVITGGSGATTSVELIRSDWSTCTLPSLPQGRKLHSQVGMTVCGGLGGPPGSDTSTSCLTFSAGSWNRSHTLSVPRYGHVSWSSFPGGVLLLGGEDSDARGSTELLSTTSSTTASQFGLKYEIRYV